LEYHVFAGLNWLKLPLVSTLDFSDQEDEIFNQENNKANNHVSKQTNK